MCATIFSSDVICVAKLLAMQCLGMIILNNILCVKSVKWYRYVSYEHYILHYDWLYHNRSVYYCPSNTQFIILYS